MEEVGRPVDHRRGQHPHRQAPYPRPRDRCPRTTAVVPVCPRKGPALRAGLHPCACSACRPASDRFGTSNAMSTATAVWSPSVSPAAAISDRGRCDRDGRPPTAEIHWPMWRKKTRHAAPVAASGPARSRCPGTGAAKTGYSNRPITADPTTSGPTSPQQCGHSSSGCRLRAKISVRFSDLPERIPCTGTRLRRA